jgi:hypothetical protein
MPIDGTQVFNFESKKNPNHPSRDIVVAGDCFQYRRADNAVRARDRNRAMLSPIIKFAESLHFLLRTTASNKTADGWRPSAGGQALRCQAAGNSMERSLGAVTEGQQLGLSSRSTCAK